MALGYDTVLFDLDGTLLNTLEDLAAAVNYVLEKYSEPQRSIDEIRCFVGNGIRRLMIRAVPGGEENPTFEQQFTDFSTYYLHHDRVRTKPYEGILKLLEECRERGIQTAIVSNKYQAATEDLRAYYFADLIPVAVGAGEGRRTKPAPDAPMEALKRLDAMANPVEAPKKSRRVLYVGDSDVDAQTAANSKMDCALVSWGFRDRGLLQQQTAVAVCDNPEELLGVITGGTGLGDGNF